MKGRSTRLELRGVRVYTGITNVISEARSCRCPNEFEPVADGRRGGLLIEDGEGHHQAAAGFGASVSAPYVRRGRFASQAVISEAGQPIEFSPSSVGAGNVPARTRRQMVVRDRPVRAITSGGRNMGSFMGEASCRNGTQARVTGRKWTRSVLRNRRHELIGDSNRVLRITPR